MELWRPINVDGYENFYEISNEGRLRTIKTGLIRTLSKNSDGYVVVKLNALGKYKGVYLHRAVWETFVGKIPEGLEIDHLNRIRDDNKLENLEVVDRKENIRRSTTNFGRKGILVEFNDGTIKEYISFTALSIELTGSEYQRQAIAAYLIGKGGSTFMNEYNIKNIVLVKDGDIK